LPCDPSYLHYGQARRVGQNYGHLQDDLQLVPDRVRLEVTERFGAVAGLQDEGIAHFGFSE
jgi:hypothetical protein